MGDFNKPTTNAFFLFVSSFVILFLCSSISYSKEIASSKTYEVSDTGKIKEGNIITAREQAIKNSLDTAVENAAKEFIPFDSLNMNIEKLRTFIKRFKTQFIQNYKVINETRIEEDYWVTVQATVATKRLKKKLSEAGILSTKKTMPSVLFLLSEHRPGSLAPSYWWGEITANQSVAEDSMAKVMAEKGFLTVNHAMVRQNTEQELIINTAYPNNKEAVRLGSIFGADMVIVGSAYVEKSEYDQEQDKNYQKGILTARALITGSGQQIGFTRQTDMLQINNTVDFSNVLVKIGNLAGLDLAEQVALAWKNNKKEAIRCEIIVEGTRDLENFVAFRRELKGISTVENVQLASIQTNTASLMVTFHGNMKSFSKMLKLKSFDAFDINLLEITREYIKIAITERFDVENFRR